MLGKTVRVRITNPYGSVNKRNGFRYLLNFGMIENERESRNYYQFAYVMGIHHPIKHFEGRVIAVIRYNGSNKVTWIIAPKSTRFINIDVKAAVSFALKGMDCNIECLFESSCGAVVYNENKGGREFLLIRNSRSSNWGFPKGHMEDGETKIDTAIREVKEETGKDIAPFEDFEESSMYIVQGRIEKSVTFFLAKSEDKNVERQVEEIDEIIWCDFDRALKHLNFENDRRVLISANEYIERMN